MTCSNPLVSVNCLTYNHESYLRKCLDGLLAQNTDFDYEILVHDDASTDGTPDIVREYAARYPDKIFPVLQTENQCSRGVPVTPAIQIPRARGKYIAVCEGDDWWSNPDKLQMEVNFLESHPDYGMVFTDYDRYLQNEDRYIRACFKNGYTPRPLDFSEYLSSFGYIAPPTWLLRKELFPKWNKDFVDGSFYISLCYWAQSKVHFIPEVTAVYRVNDGGISHVREARAYGHRLKGVFSIQRMIMRANPGLITPDVREKVNSRIMKIGLYCSTIGDYQTLEVGRRYATLLGNRKYSTLLTLAKCGLVRIMLKALYRYHRDIKY